MSNESDALARQEATILRTVPTPATAVDNRGVERIIEPYTDGWKPAPVKPDPDEVARLERIGGVLEEKAEERAELFRTGTGSGGAATGAETAKEALEESHFGGGGESDDPVIGDGPAEDVAAGPGQIRDSEGRSAVEQAEERVSKRRGRQDSDEGDGELKGEALDAALEQRGLSKDGTADEKRARVAEHDAQQP